ncbi:MAG: YdcF family protein [Marinospirillum sp.]|nr:YdcF family protein [Marinospirillum sp.]
MINLLKYLLLPPLFNILLLLAGLLLFWLQKRKLALLLISSSTLILLALSLPLVSHALMRPLEVYPPLNADQLHQQQVLVVLGGGREYSGAEYGWDDAPSEATISRLNYAAYLHSISGLPLLVTGGRVHDEAESEAELMARLLQSSFGIHATWLEEQSRTTHENALFSAEILKQQGINEVVLISHAWHLARAVPIFEAQGLQVTPAPLQFSSPPTHGLIRWIPRTYHLNKSTQALHEWLGRMVYSFYK